MRKLLYLISYFMVSYVYALSVDGSWLTKDEVTQKDRSIVKLQTVNNIVSGTIEKVFPKPGDTGICAECPGKFKDKPVIGLKLLWGLKQKDTSSWDGGHILDPKTGKIYKLRMTLKGDKLYVRGYIGVSFLGRTQIWTRA